MTAAWLDAHATFGPRTHVSYADRLEFGTGSAGYEKLLEVPLIPAGTLSAAKPYKAHIKLWMNDLCSSPSDCDLIAGLSDGLVFAGFFRNEGDLGNPGFGVVAEGNDGPLALTNVVLGPGGNTSTGAKKWFEVTIRLTSNTEVLASAGSDTLPVLGSTSVTLDRTGALSVVIVGHEADEQYAIYAVEVQIREEAP